MLATYPYEEYAGRSGWVGAGAGAVARAPGG
jgi:hypothetical protein